MRLARLGAAPIGRTAVISRLPHGARARPLVVSLAAPRRGSVITIRLSSTTAATPLPTDPSGVKSTLPSSSHPQLDTDASKSKGHDADSKDGGKKPEHVKGDRGYLSFTKSQLFKLTLPLAPPASNPASPASKETSALAQAKRAGVDRQANDGQVDSSPSEDQTWEQLSDAGHVVSQTRPALTSSSPPSPDSTPERAKDKARAEARSRRDKTGVPTSLSGGYSLISSERGSDDPSEAHDASAPAHSVVFLIHSAQPIWYISQLIRAEGPSARPAKDQKHAPHPPGMPPHDTADSETPPITFHTRPGPAPRWSPATGLGDFLREASRLGSFVIRIGNREIYVSVPSFEDRSRFLRSRLYALMENIEGMARLKADCDKIARQGTRRLAYTGAAGLATWWVAVAYISFATEAGWDVMEPVVTVTGLGAAMAGYVWFLLHDREVTYRTVLRETTSRRQQALYSQKGLDLEVYEELIEQAKELRARIKAIANDYDLEWDQGNTASAKHSKKALDVVRAREAQEEKGGKAAKKAEEKGSDPDEDEDEEEEDAERDGEEAGGDEARKNRAQRAARKDAATASGGAADRGSETGTGTGTGTGGEGEGKNTNKALREKKSSEK